jgi:hypothetical protein
LARLTRLHVGRVSDGLEQLAFELAHPKRERRWEAPSRWEDRLALSVRRGAAFLKRHQARNGSLSGFLLPPGASTTWLTAHVAFVLEDVPQVRRLRRRAADYLATVGPEDGGWGYNRAVGVDIDSSAQALMVLHSLERSVPDYLERIVIDAQDSGGGFPTYRPAATGRPASAWQRPHLDVSLIVLEWLRRTGRYPAALQRCTDWVRSQIREGRSPESYWWPDPEYGHWALARAGMAEMQGADVMTAVLDRSFEPPQLAMALSAGLLGALDAHALRDKLEALLEQQFDDGSWPCARCLRVTSPTWTGHGPEAPGRVYADHRRMFSTAHCVAAIHSALH